jgi:hypothetical protein
MPMKKGTLLSWTREEIKEVRTLARLGYSAREIGDEVDRTRLGVKGICKRHRIKLHPPNPMLNPFLRARVIELLASGMTRCDVARHLEMSFPWIYRLTRSLVQLGLVEPVGRIGSKRGLRYKPTRKWAHSGRPRKEKEHEADLLEVPVQKSKPCRPRCTVYPPTDRRRNGRLFQQNVS